MDEFVKELQARTTAEVRTDTITKRAYSVDASIYEIEPLAVVIPKSQTDLIATLKIARDYSLPIIPRGAATGITGGCIGSGIIVDLSKYLHRIIEINYDGKYAIVEPGVVQDQLNRALHARGYRLGPDTSTGNRATIGGMLANNSAGAQSLRYGKMSDHVLEVELALASGELISLTSVDEHAWARQRAQDTTNGHLLREMFRIREQYRDEIARRFPHIPRRVSGYNLDALIQPGPFNPCKLIAGAEGTLGIATKIKVAISPLPQASALCVIHCRDMMAGMQAVTALLAFHPLSLEMIDDKIIASGRQSPAMRGKLDWLVGNPQAVFVVECEGATQQQAAAQAQACAQAMQRAGIGEAHVVLSDPQSISKVWAVRKEGLGLLLSRRTYSRAIAFIEDLTLPPDKLADFMIRFKGYLKSVGKEAGIYGHVGSGCMHIRPYIDLRQEDELHLMRQMMEEVSDMVLEFGGALSGEHGDGLIRSWLNKKMFGDQVYQAFVELKSAFDPENRMNPGKIVHPSPLEKDLRLDPHTHVRPIPTFLDFTDEGGIELAADLCNGNGMCRKKESTMCPSFQASDDEYHTTRARAQALRSVINGRAPLETWTSAAMYDVLDLCIECKGCKTECPSQVDMAKMKAELLYQYQETHGYPLRNRLFGQLGSFLRLASPWAKTFNRLSSSRLVKAVLNWVGMTSKRDLPPLAPQTFSCWLKEHYKPQGQRSEVVLYNDTYTEYLEPQIGIAAVKVLTALGYDVIVPPWHCCGRPLISKGMLRQAKQHAQQVCELTTPYIQRGLPIIGLEPSCLSALTDDFKGLLGKRLEKGISFDEFIFQHLTEGRLPLALQAQERVIKLHGHCHQKALVGTKPTLAVLKAIPGCQVDEIESGCCGMAGAFGYEKEHYDFSIKIGELKLLPAVRSASPKAIIVANGLSCRTQIAHGTGRVARHLAEVLADALSDS